MIRRCLDGDDGDSKFLARGEKPTRYRREVRIGRGGGKWRNTKLPTRRYT